MIDSDGTQLGIMDTRSAIARAQEKGLDLVEVAPQASPPVCKILDYGKYKYEQKKKQKASKKKQSSHQIKEIQLRPRTDEHDIDTKVRHILRFLEEQQKVKITVRFRGREAAYSDLGYQILNNVIQKVGEAGLVEQKPKMEGRLLSALIAPKR